MRIAIIGRTNILLETAKFLNESGFEIPLIITSSNSDYDNLQQDSFKNFAASINASYINTTNLTSKQVENKIVESKCEYAISMNWQTLIKKSTIELFNSGILNIHPGDLPRYRGNATVNWAILNNENQIGLTLHFMNEKLDEGPIVNKLFYKLDDKSYVGDVYDWIQKSCPSFVFESLKGLENKSIKIINQFEINTKPMRCYPRKPEDSQINWNNSNKDIFRLIRASSKPFLGAYSFLSPSNEKVIIWKAIEITYDFDYYAIPGQICYTDKNYPVISTQNGFIKILDAKIDDLSSENSLKMIASSMRNRLVQKYN